MSNEACYPSVSTMFLNAGMTLLANSEVSEPSRQYCPTVEVLSVEVRGWSP